ncbi:MAG: DNA topoisomerase 4 subunit A [Proteobacteria bacterium]|nr:DNA topoisomerase 4 subunit A [Pseudomonadota bacterium]
MEQQDFFNKNINDDSVSYLDEMQESFIDYAMSVITSRALPDIRDGLKPVQRRILFAMANEGLFHDKKYSKCAGIVGEVLKKYHPHGDVAVYDALVRMAQSWVMRYALVEGQGNFGSIDGDSPAAYRYTEARLDKLSSYLMMDIEKETVDKIDNYNNTDKEPIVLPTRFPNLLINGASGIAVGMATNIPPHNLIEILDATIALVKNPEMKTEKLLEYVKGPDFPTAASIIEDKGIKEAYTTGRGTIRIRAEIIVEKDKDKKRIIITEIPYGIVKTRITTRIVELIKTKKLEGITDIRDESTKEGVRLVLDISKSAPVDFIIEKLYKNTPLDSNFAVNMVALIDGRPKLVNLKEILEIFIEYREEVVRRRTIFELKKAEEKKHLLEGFVKVLSQKERYLKEILPKSKDKTDLKAKVEQEFSLSPIQSEALVILPNYRFSGLEVDKIKAEHAELSKEVEELLSILNSEEKIRKILIKEFTEIKTKFPEIRRTRIVSDFEDKKLVDLIPSQEVMVSITQGGFIKRYNMETEQNGDRESNVVFTGDDIIRYITKANMAERVLVFCSDAKVYPLRVFSLPEMRRYGKGVDIKELLKLKENVNVAGVFDEAANTEIIVLTKKGYAKKLKLEEFKGIKSNGVSVFSLRKDDEVVAAEIIGSEYLAILEDKGTITRVKMNKIELSSRGQAPAKISTTYLAHAFMQGEKDKTIIAYSSGNIGTPSSAKDKTIAVMTNLSGVEFVAVTSSGKYILINNLSEPIPLDASDKLEKVFTYYN